jgi:histone-lysine N-methyltransferase SETMAR
MSFPLRDPYGPGPKHDVITRDDADDCVEHPRLLCGRRAPKGAAFDTDYSCGDILSEILRLCPERSNHRLTFHVDNARPHTSKRTKEFMEQSNLRGAPHLPFSLDLIPSDLFLFGYIKDKLQGSEFIDKDVLLAETRAISNRISGKVLKGVFMELERRLQTCIHAKGEYA